jgi:hypothetical protein
MDEEQFVNEPDLYAAVAPMWLEPQSGELKVLEPPRALAVVVADLESERLPDTPTKELALHLARALDKALAELSNVSEAADLRSKAKHMSEYLQERGAELAEANLINKRRLLLERTIGEQLRKTVTAGNPNVTRHDNSSDKMRPGRIPDGISRNQSSDWQRLAQIPEPDFQQYLDDCLENEKEITTGGALGVWYKLNRAPLPFEDAGFSDDVPPPDEMVERTVYLTCPQCGYENEQNAFARRVEE